VHEHLAAPEWRRSCRFADTFRDLQFKFVAISEPKPRELREVMRDRAHWLALVSQSHRLGRERVCEGQPTCERFRVGHEQRVHELAIPQMPTERNILSIPERLW